MNWTAARVRRAVKRLSTSALHHYREHGLVATGRKTSGWIIRRVRRALAERDLALAPGSPMPEFRVEFDPARLKTLSPSTSGMALIQEMPVGLDTVTAVELLVAWSGSRRVFFRATFLSEEGERHVAPGGHGLDVARLSLPAGRTVGSDRARRAAAPVSPAGSGQRPIAGLLRGRSRRRRTHGSAPGTGAEGQSAGGQRRGARGRRQPRLSGLRASRSARPARHAALPRCRACTPRSARKRRRSRSSIARAMEPSAGTRSIR